MAGCHLHGRVGGWNALGVRAWDGADFQDSAILLRVVAEVMDLMIPGMDGAIGMIHIVMMIMAIILTVALGTGENRTDIMVVVDMTEVEDIMERILDAVVMTMAGSLMGKIMATDMKRLIIIGVTVMNRL